MTNYLKLASQFSLVFDLDGTLIDSAPDLHDAVNSILPSYGLRRISIKETQAFIGDGMPNLCEHALEATGGSPEIRQAFCDGRLYEQVRARRGNNLERIELDVNV